MTASFSRRARPRTCALVLASAVLLTACGAETAAEPTASKSTTATPSSSATPSATASATPTETPAPEPAAPVTVTTPNGLHSFTLPAGWSAVPAEPLPIPAHDVGYVSPAAFAIMDASGAPVAEFYSGVSLDGAAIPSAGHVIYDAQQLEGYISKLGEPVYFQFESRPVYTYEGPSAEVTGRSYHVQLESGPLPDANGMDAGPIYGTVFKEDGGIRFHAILQPAVIADDASARAWMETDTYRQLKEMMLSLTYNG